MDHEHSIFVPIKNIFFKKVRLLANFSQATSSKEGNMVDLLKSGTLHTARESSHMVLGITLVIVGSQSMQLHTVLFYILLFVALSHETLFMVMEYWLHLPKLKFSQKLNAWVWVIHKWIPSQSVEIKSHFQRSVPLPLKQVFKANHPPPEMLASLNWKLKVTSSDWDVRRLLP